VVGVVDDRDDLLLPEPVEDLEVVATPIDDARLLDLGGVNLGVTVVILHEKQDLIEAHPGNEDRAVPVMEETVLDLDLGIILRTRLQSLDENLATLQALERLFVVFPRETIDVEEGTRRRNIGKEARLGRRRVPLEGLQRVRLELGRCRRGGKQR